jgi:hypothetical protein
MVFLLGTINKKRNLEITDICVICGVEREDNFHTFCRCPLAVSLWRAMAEVWKLSDPSTVANTRKEWVLHLIDGKTEFDRAKVLLLLWRIWHVRNEVVHHKAPPPVEASKRFLCSYLESIATIKYYPQADGIKGKEPMIMWESQTKKKAMKRNSDDPPRRWSPPPEGWRLEQAERRWVFQ